MRPPAFWAEPRRTWQSALLAPAAAAYGAVASRRIGRPGYRVPVPVLCCGNVTLGGAGKTVLALDLVRRLTEMGRHPHVLLRGYRGSIRGPHRVSAADTHRTAGDEALLLARAAPTWVGADRAASARSAVAAGADVLVMDDGLQNPTLEKTASLLVIDGGVGFGNGRIFPAGPLRELVPGAAARCRAAVIIGEDITGVRRGLPPALPVLRARMAPGAEIAALHGRDVVAFAGIGRPEKFFAMLRESGLRMIETRAFPDHHDFSAGEVAALLKRAADAVLVTTQKDAVRLPEKIAAQVSVVSVRLQWQDEEELCNLLHDVVPPGVP